MFQLLVPKPQARAVVFMGSPTDMSHCEKIRTNCQQLGVPCELRVSSAHKATEETMKILAEYEGGVSELINPNSENKRKSDCTLNSFKTRKVSKAILAHI